jgi:hypothetical protein
MLLLVTPLSLGFMMSKSSTPAPQLLGTSAQLANSGKFQQGLGHSPSSLQAQNAPSANNAGNIFYEQESGPPTPSVHRHKRGEHGHKHGHEGNGHKHKDDDSPHTDPEVDIAV